MFLMALALGLFAPVVDSMLHPNQVAASIDTVRAQWMEARGRAMEEGRPYRFSVQENSGNFKIEPDDTDDPNSEAGMVREGDLPQPCIFVEDAEGLQGMSGNPVSSGTWRVVAVFLPEGT